MDNTRPVRTNTADRAAFMLMTHKYVRILVCTVCFEWNIHTNPVHSSAHRVVTTDYGAGRYPQERSNYELLGKWWTTRAPYAQTLQTVRQTRSWHRGTCAYLFARSVFRGTFRPTGYIPVNYELKQQITVPVDTLIHDIRDTTYMYMVPGNPVFIHYRSLPYRYSLFKRYQKT